MLKFLCLLLLIPSLAYAQNNPGVTITGAVTANDCVKFVNGFTITDSGGGCGSGTITASPQYEIPHFSASGTASTLAGSSGITTDANNVLNITSGSVTTSDPALNISQTWNNGSTTFTGINESITNTASNSASLLMNLQFGGTSEFNVSESGGISFAGINQHLSCNGTSVFCNNGGTLVMPSQIFLGGVVFSGDNPNGGSFFKLSGSPNSVYFGNIKNTGYTNVLSLGDGESSTPSTQALAGQNADYGTDLNGGNLIIQSGVGTGAGTGGSIIFEISPVGASSSSQNALVNVMQLNSGGATMIGTTTQANSSLLTVNGTVSDNTSTLIDTAGTGLSKSSQTLNSNAIWQASFQPGLLTAITNTIGVYSKVSKASTVDNMIASAVLLTCATNPTVTFYDCGTSTTCASPTTIASVQVTASGTATPATISNSAITSGDYIGFAISAGTCTSLDISATAQIHSN